MDRFIDLEMNPLRLPSVNGYLKHQSPSLEQIFEPILSRIKQLDQFVQMAKAKCHFPSEHGLTHDESAAIFLYTMELDDDHSFYRIMQKDMYCKNRSVSQSWQAYLKLFNDAIQKLPSNRVNVWRCMNNTICKKLKKDDEFNWWNITSCSSSKTLMQDNLKINSNLCLIETIHGKDISIYSSRPNQNEIILCPGARLQVVSNKQNQPSSSILHLREIDRQIPLSSSIKTIVSRWYTNGISSIMSQMSLVIIAILITIVARKVLTTTFKSSYISTVLTGSGYQAMQIISSSKNEFNQITMMEKPLTSHVFVDVHGNRYEGEWKDGRKHGKGKMNYVNGHQYSGDWMDDVATGEGVFIWSNGDQYEGQVKNGQRHGKGSYYFSNGDKYIGDWIEDKKAGYGATSLVVGRYEGQFQDDKMYGKGTFYFANGDIYVGDWIDNKQEGQGVFNWSNNDRYEGGFKAGKLHGKGSYYFGNGNKFTGEWNNGERVMDHGAFTWANNPRRSDENHSNKDERPNISKSND